MLRIDVSSLFIVSGIAMRVHDSDTIESMLHHADGAMYQAKSQGRGGTLASA